MKGKLYGIGVGPGDPELVTLKAMKVIEKVPVIAVPKSKKEGESIVLDIAERYIDRTRQEIIEWVFPMIQDEEKLRAFWMVAVNQILKRLGEGKDVAYLCLGDPLLYSTFCYLFLMIREDHPDVTIEVIPGVSSITSVAASAGIPLAIGQERLALLSATSDLNILKEISERFDTIIVMKVNRCMDRVIAILEEIGLKDRAVFVSRAGWEEEEVVYDLDSLKGRELDYFSMVIVKN